LFNAVTEPEIELEKEPEPLHQKTPSVVSSVSETEAKIGKISEKIDRFKQKIQEVQMREKEEEERERKEKGDFLKKIKKLITVYIEKTNLFHKFFNSF
jgi:TolA-binding protein